MYQGAEYLSILSNFIEHKEGETPAMREGSTDHVWTWKEFLRYHI